MSKIFRWIFRKELTRLENIPEQVKNLNEAIILLNTKLDAIHESMQKELARFDDDLQKIADLGTENQDRLKAENQALVTRIMVKNLKNK